MSPAGRKRLLGSSAHTHAESCSSPSPGNTSEGSQLSLVLFNKLGDFSERSTNRPWRIPSAVCSMFSDIFVGFFWSVHAWMCVFKCVLVSAGTQETVGCHWSRAVHPFILWQSLSLALNLLTRLRCLTGEPSDSAISTSPVLGLQTESSPHSGKARSLLSDLSNPLWVQYRRRHTERHTHTMHCFYCLVDEKTKFKGQ